MLRSRHLQLNPYNIICSEIKTVGAFVMVPLHKVFVLTWVTILGWSAMASTSSDNNCTFRAAVYEHAYHPSLANPIDNMLDNLQTYERHVSEAAKQGAQIIVFPEVGITGLAWDSDEEVYYQVVKDPKKAPDTPCLTDELTNETLVPYHLSCMARDNHIMVVANFPTRVSCGDFANASCPSRGEYHLNTNAVFDTNGTVVALYNKVNLYSEPQYDLPPTIEHSYFDTDFGRFGIITCFDLLWKEPTVTLVEQYEVDTILFPTAWMDQLPYLASVQAQAAWAAGLGVNLLAANIHFPIAGFMGSGLYNGANGPVLYSYTTNCSEGKLLVADLPCQGGTKSISGPPQMPWSTETAGSSVLVIHHRIKYQDLSEFVATPLLEERGDVQLCQGSLCCYATYEMTTLPASPGRYMLVIRQGNVSEEDIYTISAEICSVLWCQDGQLSSCAIQPSNISISLTHLELWGNFSTPYLYPAILLDDLQLQSADQWYFQSTSGRCKPESSDGNVWCPVIRTDIATTATSISIYGRCYDLDVTPYPT